MTRLEQRPADCLSDLALDRIVAGAARDAHLDGCERCRNRLAAFEHQAQAARPTVAALIQRAEAAKTDGAKVGALANTGARTRWWRWWSIGGALVAAAAAVVIFVMQPGDEVRLKGTGIGVKMYRMRRGEVTLAHSGDSFAKGDALRFVVSSPRAAQYALVEVEAAGKITVQQRGQVNVGTTALDGSWVLDASPNTEWFVVLIDPKDPLVAVRDHEGVWLEIRK